MIASLGLRAVYAIAIAAVLIAALRPQSIPGQSQPIAQSVPAAAPSPIPVAPSPQTIEVYDPQTAALVSQVKSWDIPTLAEWVSFCAQTRSGLGYSQADQNVCTALKLGGLN